MDYVEIAGDPFDGSGALSGDWLSVNPDNGGTPSRDAGAAVSGTSSGAAAGGGGTCVWVGAGTFTANQRVRFIFDGKANLSASYFCGGCVRMSTDLNAARDLKGVSIELDGSGDLTTRVFKIINGTAGYASLVSTPLPWVNGDEGWLDAIGDDLFVYRQGVLVPALTVTGDTDLPSGQPGFIIGGQTANPRLNLWAAGNLVEAGAPAPPSYALGGDLYF